MCYFIIIFVVRARMVVLTFGVIKTGGLQIAFFFLLSVCSVGASGHDGSPRGVDRINGFELLHKGLNQFCTKQFNLR